MRRGLAEPSRWGNRWLALGALLAGAAAIRLVGVRYGLPYPLIDPDEESIVPRAWRMSHGGGLDPSWFDHPSLLMYLVAPFENWADHPSYLTARLVVVALGVAGVVAAWWLGSRSYGTLAGFVAAAVTAVEVTHVAYSRMAVTDVPMTLGVAVALALMVSGRLPAAGAAIGVAAGVKYPAVTLLAPLLVAGWGQWRRLAVAGILAVGAFLLTTPYFVVHFGEAVGDVRRVEELARRGSLGFENDHVAPIAFVDRLWEGMGPALLVALLGLALALVRRTYADRILAAFVLVYFATLLPLDAHFDRYVLPLVPALGALAGRVRSLASVTLLLLVIPLVWSIGDTAPLTKTDTRIAARNWMQANLTPGVLVAADPSTATPGSLRLIRLSLPGPGRPLDPERDVASLRRLGVGYVVVNGEVADHVAAAGDRYRQAVRFYEELRRTGNRRFYRAANGKLAGPWVAVYEL